MATTDLLDLLQPALDRYTAALAEHRPDYSGDQMGRRCTCGWTPGRTSSERRSVALHVAAADKRASKVYDAESAEILRNRKA